MPEFVKHITQNQEFLITHFSDGDTIIIRLTEKGVLSGNEQEELDAENVPNKKAKTFWNILKKKGSFLPIIIQAFKNSSCDARVAAYLQKFLDQTAQSTGTATTTTPNAGENVTGDFVVSEEGAFVITQILENYPKLEDNWLLVVPIKLGFSGKAKGEIKNFKNFGGLVALTLSLWREEKGEDSKFNAFLAAIKRDLKNKLAAEDLEKNRTLIKNAK